MNEQERLSKTIKDLFKSGEWPKILTAIRQLRENTGENCVFDPYRSPDGLPWNWAGVFFWKNGRFSEALTVFQSQLDRYLEIQEKSGKRIHKGTPYHFLGQAYLNMGNRGYAREQSLLAFVEDTLTELQTKESQESIPNVTSALDCPAAIVLELTFRMRAEELRDLYEYTTSLVASTGPSSCLYPETILLTWRNSKERNKAKGLLHARAVEEMLFHSNPFYLRKLLAVAQKDPSGKGMEALATYLFSCVDGFEPIPKKHTGAYHFDVVVRNLVQTHPLLSMLGEYIGVEAKNLKTSVTAQDLNHFIQKLRLHNMHCGVIFTKTKISGLKDEAGSRYGASIQLRTFNRDNVIVFDIKPDDIQRVVSGSNLISLLLVKYEAIKYK